MRSGEMHKSNIPSVKGVAGVASVNTRAGVVTLVPSDVGITATTPKSVPFVGAGGFLGEDNAHFNYTVGTHTLAVTNLAAGTLLSAPTIAASLLMTTPEIDLGATPFVFKEPSPGVLQIGIPGLTVTASNGDLLSTSNDGPTFQSTGATTVTANSPISILLTGTDSGAGYVNLTIGTTTYNVAQQIAITPNNSLGNGATLYMDQAGKAYYDSSGNGFVAPATPGISTDGDVRGAGTGYFGTSVVSPLYSVASGAGNSGITTTITTASLVGKTITVQGGIITGFA